MQLQLVNNGVTVEASNLQSLNQFFHSPALLGGGELSVSYHENKYTLRIAPHTVSLPNGIILYETETREISFLRNGWKTIYYLHANTAIEDFKYNTTPITNPNHLGGSPANLYCVEGAFNQQELNSISEEMIYSTIVAWVHPIEGGIFEIVRPNNEYYSKFSLIPADYKENKIYGKSLIDYFYFDNNETYPNKLATYDLSLGHIRLNGEEGVSGVVFLQNVYPIEIKIPFDVDKFGSFVIDRKAEAGAEMQFSMESVDGEEFTLENGTDYFDSKGNYILSGSENDLTVQDYSTFSNDAIKTIRTEPQFFETIIRPKWERFSFYEHSEKTYRPNPRYFVLKITIPPFDSVESTGTDGIQWLRSIGFSKYNVPQERYF